MISKMYSFEAAHMLPRHPGKCRNMHGHSWRVEVVVTGSVNPDTGFVLDYDQLDQWVEPIIERFDHQLLNCYVQYPSSENIAKHIAYLMFGSISTWIRFKYMHLTVRVSETQKCWAEYASGSPSELALTDPDPGWRSPQLHDIDNVAEALTSARKKATGLEQEYLDAMIRYNQLRLYMDAIDMNPKLPEELKK